MKKMLLPLVVSLCLAVPAAAQAPSAASATATPELVSQTAQAKTYRFECPKKISKDKEDRIAERVRQSFPGLETVTIRDQQVTITVNNSMTEQSLGEMFKLFGYNAYNLKSKK